MPAKKITEKIDIRKLRKRIVKSIEEKTFLASQTRKSILTEYDRFYRSKPLLLRFEKKINQFTNDVNSKLKLKTEKKRVEGIKTQLKNALKGLDNYLNFRVTIFAPTLPNYRGTDFIEYNGIRYQNRNAVIDLVHKGNAEFWRKILNEFQVVPQIDFDNPNNKLNKLIQSCDNNNEFFNLYFNVTRSIDNVIILVSNISVTDNSHTALNIRTAQSFMSNAKQICSKRKDKCFSKIKLNNPEYTNDYVRDNFVPYTCWITLLLNVYNEPISKHWKKEKGNLSYIKIHQMIAPDRVFKDTNNGYSYDEVIKFFEFYGLSLYMFDVNMNLLLDFKPTKTTHDISPKVLYVQYHNHHIYHLTENLKSLEQYIVHKPTEELMNNPSCLYPVFKRGEDNKVLYLGFNEIVDKMKEIFQFEATKDSPIDLKIRYYYYNCADLWKYFYHQLNIEFKVGMRGNNICFDTLIYEDVNKRVVIQSNMKEIGLNFATSIEEFGDSESVVVKAFENFENKKAKVNNELLTRTYISSYHPNVKNMLNTYMRPPIFGQVCKVPRNQKHGIKLDFNKYYTSILKNIKHIPIVNSFDTFRDYQGEPVEEYNLYFVEKLKMDGAYPFYRFSLCYGMNLNNVENIRIISVLHVSKVVKYDKAKPLIETLYKDESLTPTLRKDLINHVVGMYNKHKNIKNHVSITTDEEQAYMFKEKYNGKVKSVPTYEGEMGLYAHYIEKSASLDNGFRLIALMVYDIAHKIILDLKQKVESTSISIKHVDKKSPDDISLLYGGKDVFEWEESVSLKVYFMNTDCLDIAYKSKHDNYDLKNCPQLFEKFVNENPDLFCKIEDKNTYESMGKLKIEKIQVDFSVIEKVDYMSNLFTSNLYSIMDNALPVVNHVQLEDEFNQDEICTKLQDKMIIEAEVAGAGKTSAWLYNAIKNKEKTIIATPYNVLCLKLREKVKHEVDIGNIEEGQIQVITLAKLLGYYIQDSEEKSTKKRYNVDGVQRIIFDEIYLHDVYKLHQINRFMTEHSNILFGATGDAHQLDAIDNSVNNVVCREDYFRNIIHSMFPKVITLRENKRCKPADRQKMKELTFRIRNAENKLVIHEIFKEFGIKIITKKDQIITTKNVCALNSTCDAVNQIVKQNMNISDETDDYKVGLDLVCRTSLQVKLSEGRQARTIVNEIYSIVGIENNMIRLSDGDEVEFLIKRVLVNQHFRLPYTRTCHSYQGLSEEEPITIFDMDAFMVDNKWVYTAITRTTALENLTIYYGEPFKTTDLEKIIKTKIDGHKKADEDNQREIIGKYVDVKWVMDKLKTKTCNKCLRFLDISGQQCFSINRLDNNIAHIKSNCEVICLNCNVSIK